MAGSTKEGWEDGTAVAGPAYTDAIAQSEPDFESELGTAVAPNDYVENVRKSATVETAVPSAAPGKQGAPRAPTMAFGTPVLLRAPAPTPAAAVPSATPAIPERRTPLPGMRSGTDAIPQPIGMRGSRSTQSRKPAPSRFVDQPFDESERKSGVMAVPDAPADERPSRKTQTAAATPLARECTSGPMPRVSERRAIVGAAEERHSGPVVQARDGRYGTPPPRLTPVSAPGDPIEDDGGEDESAGDLDTFDNAETMGQPQRLESAPVIARPTPVPLRPTTPAPIPLLESLPPLPAYLGGTQPLAPTAPALLPPLAVPPPLAPPGALPTSYPMVSADSVQAFKASPLSAPTSPGAAPAPATRPRSRALLIGVSTAVVIALGIGAYVFLLSGNTKPHAIAAAKTSPAAIANHPVDKPVVEAPAVQTPVADKPPIDKPVTSVKTTEEPPATEIPTTTTKLPKAPPVQTSTKTPAKTSTKTPAKAIAKAKAPATKATRKVVKKAPVKKAPAKKVPAPAKPCNALDCL